MIIDPSYVRPINDWLLIVGLIRSAQDGTDIHGRKKYVTIDDLLFMNPLPNKLYKDQRGYFILEE